MGDDGIVWGREIGVEGGPRALGGTGRIPAEKRRMGKGRRGGGRKGQVGAVRIVRLEL